MPFNFLSAIGKFIIQTRFVSSIIRAWSRNETRVKIAISEYKAAKRRARIMAAQQRLNNLTYEDCNPQLASPLFNVLPGELRNEILKWALVQYDDPDPEKQYEEDSYWYRPGFRAAKRSESGLLRTCRLIYCESRRLVMREAEHAFWFGKDQSFTQASAPGICLDGMLIQRRSPSRPTRPFRHE